MATVVVYRWVTRPSSRSRGGVIYHRAREERHLHRVILAPSPSWYNFGERAQESRRVPAYLNDVLRNVRAATQDFTQLRGNFDPRGELAVSVCAAQLVIQSVPIPAMAQQTCLMCASPVANQRMPQRRIPIRVKIEHRHICSSWFWTLHEVMVFPSWRVDVDSPPRLCTFHRDEFSRAIAAVLWGFVLPPVQTRSQRRRSI